MTNNINPIQTNMYPGYNTGTIETWDAMAPDYADRMALIFEATLDKCGRGTHRDGSPKISIPTKLRLAPL